MSSARTARAFQVRHLQFARALLAAVAAAMITFSPDHSAQYGLAVFSGFAITTGLVFLGAAWAFTTRAARWAAFLLGVVTLPVGMVGGLVMLRSVTMFFVLVIAWAAVTGTIETVAGVRAYRGSVAATSQRSEACDALAIGILTLVLAVGLALVPSGYALSYHIEDAGQSFTLTGISIGVGVFGAYAAITAVYLGIAAFSPRKPAVAEQEPATAAPEGVR